MLSPRQQPKIYRRKNTFHLRVYVPTLVSQVTGKSEIHRSLKTSDRGVAKREAERVRRELFDWFDTLLPDGTKQPSVIAEMSDLEIADLARGVYLDFRKEVDSDLHEFLSLPSEEQRQAALDPAKRDDRLRELLADFDLPESSRSQTAYALKQRGLSLAPDAPSYLKLLKKVRDALNQVLVDVVNNYAETPSRGDNSFFIDQRSGEPIAPTSDVGRSAARSYNLSTLGRDFVNEVKTSRGPKGVQKIEQTLQHMEDFFGPNADIRNIERPEIVKFRDLLVQMPTNAKKRYPGRSAMEVIRSRKPEHDLLSIASINTHLRNVGQFLRTCAMNDRDYRSPNLDQITLVDPVDDIEKRHPFRQDDLVAIFSSHKMRDAIRSGSVYFWTFAIGLYHGLRANEITSLAPEDIIEFAGTPCLDLKIPRELLEGKRSGKSKTIPRRLPLHPILIELGLPKLADRRQGQRLLFEGLRESKDGYFSRVVSDWTSDLMLDLGWAKRKVSLHSLRHNFMDAMDDAELGEKWQSYLGGWKLPGVMHKTYGSREMKNSIIPAIAKVNYGEMDSTILSLYKESQHAA